ncbi:M23 family metallopeptidase [Nocardioides koreensis]
MRPGTPSCTARRTRLPGLALVVVLGAALALSGAGAAPGAPGEPFETARPSPPQEPPDPVGVWPLEPVPEVVAGFDPPSSTWGAGHRGVDLLGAVGRPVRTALAGTVSFAGSIAGRGVVVVDHGDTRTTYEPVRAEVAVGDAVAAGDRIGVLQLPGSHCFPRACLHWGWLRGTTYLDPLGLVGAGPVRLLPLWRQVPVDALPDEVPSPLPRPRSPYAGWRPLVELLLAAD